MFSGFFVVVWGALYFDGVSSQKANLVEIQQKVVFPLVFEGDVPLTKVDWRDENESSVPFRFSTQTSILAMGVDSEWAEPRNIVQFPAGFKSTIPIRYSSQYQAASNVSKTIVSVKDKVSNQPLPTSSSQRL